MTPTIVTARLLLRRWSEDDRESFAEVNADPEVMAYFQGPMERMASDVLLDEIESAFDRRGFGLWAIEHRYGGASWASPD